MKVNKINLSTKNLMIKFHKETEKQEKTESTIESLNKILHDGIEIQLKSKVINVEALIKLFGFYYNKN